MTSFQKRLIEIQEKECFEKLEPFKDSNVWKQMTEDEKGLLALLLISQGAQQLAKGDNQVLTSFEIASQVSSYSPAIYYQQGTIFASYPENLRCLNLASQAFAKAIERQPSFLEAWYRWGEVLLTIGLFEAEISHLIEAELKFQKVFEILQQDPKPTVAPDFYWRWGTCWSAIGRFSGEPLDFFKAIEQYRKGSELGCIHPLFYLDYGDTLCDLASLIERPELFREALAIFNKTVEKDPDSFDAWYYRACCLQRLSNHTMSEADLEESFNSFAKAAEIQDHHSQLWLRWAQIETRLGKVKRDIQKIESSLNKYERAHQLEENHPVILSCWGETELFLGSHLENLEQIQSAKAKIIKSLEFHPESSDTWYLYGSCLNELGRYFEDAKFYYQAIEKFQYGLNLARENPLLWYGMALAHFALGDMDSNITMFEKAVRYCSQVMECGGDVFPQFWNDWGVALMKLGELTNQKQYIELAIEKFERALRQPIGELELTDIDLEWVYNYGCAHDLLGEITEETRHFEKAIHILSQLLQTDSDYTHARYNLALAYSHLGEAAMDVEAYQKGLEHFQHLLAQDPEDEMVHMDYGVSLINLALLIHDDHHPEKSQGLYRLAETHLTQAAALGSCQAYYQLAGLYSLTGHYSQAMHFIERAQFTGALPSVEELMHDDWLEGLHNTSAFRQFLNHLSSQQHNDKDER